MTAQGKREELVSRQDLGVSNAAAIPALLGVLARTGRPQPEVVEEVCRLHRH